MLLTLQVRNFALIENVHIEFGEGFNILSGETGSGKSILVQAMDLLLGGRGSQDLIREGEDEAEVTGFFRSRNQEWSLRRVLSKNGKSRAFLNERPATIQSLEDMGARLVDLVTQHAHQVLLDSEQHLSLLDEYASLTDRIFSYQESLKSYREFLQKKEELLAREHAAREKEDFLRFQMKELTEAKIQPGEEEVLQKEREILKNAVRLGDICLRGEAGLDSGEEAVGERLGRLLKEIQSVAALDRTLETIGETIHTGLCHVQEAARELRHYGERLEANPERLEEIESRLALIARLKKKYGGSVESLLEKEKEITENLNLLDDFGDEIQKIEQIILEVAERVVKEASVLSSKRREAALKIAKEIQKELKDLGFSVAKIVFSLQPLSSGVLRIENQTFDDRGCDQGEFLFEPNPGEGMRPLAKIASGGELSRIFLAIKKVLGSVNSAETCIFDEVDVGIGGGIAEVVGKNLSLLAKKKQVICVTHLPQIACYAHHHFIIQKETEKGRTHTHVTLLKDHQREEEIARMLAGIKVTTQAVAHAREMLKNANGA